MSCRYSWDFPILGKMTVFAIPGFRVRSPVDWSITAQASPSGHMRGSGLFCKEVGTFMVATWFSMRSCPFRRRVRVLHLCTCITVGFYFKFCCAVGGIGSVSSDMMWGARWGGRLGACSSWKYMSPCGSIL